MRRPYFIVPEFMASSTSSASRLRCSCNLPNISRLILSLAWSRITLPQQHPFEAFQLMLDNLAWPAARIGSQL